MVDERNSTLCEWIDGGSPRTSRENQVPMLLEKGPSRSMGARLVLFVYLSRTDLEAQMLLRKITSAGLTAEGRKWRERRKREGEGAEEEEEESEGE